MGSFKTTFAGEEALLTYEPHGNNSHALIVWTTADPPVKKAVFEDLDVICVSRMGNNPDESKSQHPSRDDFVARGDLLSDPGYVSPSRSHPAPRIQERWYHVGAISAISEDDSEKKELRYEEAFASNLPNPYTAGHCENGELLAEILVATHSSKSDTHLDIVISTHSGTKEAETFYETIVKPAVARYSDILVLSEVIFTKSESSITSVAMSRWLEKARRGIPQTILLLSGDGGVVDIVNALLSSDTTPTGGKNVQYQKPAVSLVAMGTGNALANSTGLNQDRTRGLRQFHRGKRHSLPTFTASFSPGSRLVTNEGQDLEPLPIDKNGDGVVFGAVVCSWGLHASLVADSDTTEYRKHGSGRFEMAAKALLDPANGSPPHEYRGRITLFHKNAQGELKEEEMTEESHGYVLATMVSNLDKSFKISPHSQPLDGQMHLMRFGPLRGDRVMQIMGQAYAGGNHVNDPEVTYKKIEGMRITFDENDEDGRWRRVCVDGKIVMVNKGGFVEVRKNDADVVDIIAEI